MPKQPRRERFHDTRILEHADDNDEEEDEDDFLTDSTKDNPIFKPKGDGARNDPKAAEKEKTAVRKAKAGKQCVSELAQVSRVTPSDRDAKWHVNLATYMRSYGDDVCSPASTALQRMLVHIFSSGAVRNVATFAATLREKGDLITTALAGEEMGGKEVESLFAGLGHAVKLLLACEARNVLAEAESLMMFANTGQFLDWHLGPFAREMATFIMNTRLHTQPSQSASARNALLPRIGRSSCLPPSRTHTAKQPSRLVLPLRRT